MCKKIAAKSNPISKAKSTLNLKKNIVQVHQHDPVAPIEQFKYFFWINGVTL
jgi:hypothetical protein